MKTRILTKLLVLMSVLILAVSVFAVSVGATEEVTDSAVTETEGVGTEQDSTEQETEVDLGAIFSLTRMEFAVKETAIGMLMIFSVLAVLWGVITISKVFLHDIPEKRKAKKDALVKAAEEVAAPDAVASDEVTVAPQEDEGEIVAAITAAIAVMLQSEEYKGKFESGFRVVSFSRKGGAWNKEN